MNIDTTIPMYQTIFFWIVIAFFIYSSGNFFLFLYRNNTIDNDTSRQQYTIIYSTFTIVKDILLCIALSIKEKKKESSGFDIPSFNDDWENPTFKPQNQ
jgi:hypothetical protein